MGEDLSDASNRDCLDAHHANRVIRILGRESDDLREGGCALFRAFNVITEEPLNDLHDASAKISPTQAQDREPKVIFLCTQRLMRPPHS